MNIDQFIQQSLKQIKSGIDTFNQFSEHAKAELPSKIEFDVEVDKEGMINDSKNNSKITHRIIFELKLTRMNWNAFDNEKLIEKAVERVRK